MLRQSHKTHGEKGAVIVLNSCQGLKRKEIQCYGCNKLGHIAIDLNPLNLLSRGANWFKEIGSKWNNS